MAKFPSCSRRLRPGVFNLLLFILFGLMCKGCSSGAVAVLDTSEGEIRIHLKIARTEMERQKGLMFETHLGDKEGMLFVFTDDRIHSFWMKNTFLTLDLIFIDSGGAVVDFLEMLPPCPTGPCPTYSSRRPARYALEMKGGSIQRYGLQKGNLIRFQF